MCSPSQVLGDVYTEVLEAAYPLVRRRYSSVTQDCGISKAAKDTSMLPSKIDQMKVSE